MKRGFTHGIGMLVACLIFRKLYNVSLREAYDIGVKDGRWNKAYEDRQMASVWSNRIWS